MCVWIERKRMIKKFKKFVSDVICIIDKINFAIDKIRLGISYKIKLKLKYIIIANIITFIL